MGALELRNTDNELIFDSSVHTLLSFYAELTLDMRQFTPLSTADEFNIYRLRVDDLVLGTHFVLHPDFLVETNYLLYLQTEENTVKLTDTAVKVGVFSL
ncbi:hypothetical protein I2F17_11680 [Acinetobacter sp. B10A]|uniref:hypothetical protein n=1 Tax=Acinetobacter baretiae TaxID=2605383 RepID=UPI001B3C54F9|nr:hypothetical protein [Acinetobacter baretiae]MBF7686478.1 hypothetical protein [Acinetobacter baretiae]